MIVKECGGRRGNCFRLFRLPDFGWACNLQNDSYYCRFLCMQRKSFGKMACPIARSLERVDEWRSILIIRDALHGFTRFDQFQKSLNIAPSMLTRRLSALVDAGVLQRRCYSQRPPRYEYILTEKGRDFRPVLIAMTAWGNRHSPPLSSRQD
jgi:DNA-binding HxlR family transcriptional regulator